MLLRDIHQRLQAAVAQPAFHPLKPLWGVIHLRRHRADHHNGFCPAPRRLLYRHRVADTTVKIAYPLQQRAGAVESRDRAGCADDIQPVLFLRRKVTRRIVIATAGAHPELFAGIEQS